MERAPLHLHAWLTFASAIALAQIYQEPRLRLRFYGSLCSSCRRRSD